jgi:pimeloyl-ACP methyl ester carboxylesterase
LAGVPHRIVVFEWTHGKLRPLRDLQDTCYLLERADELAALVSQTLAEEPHRPVFLVGHSAGAALVLATAEKLPPGSVERILLLSAAVSPTFNLCPALRATRHEIVAFSSCCDFFLLGLGTTLFGTVDRCYVAGAGKDGFVRPADLDEEACRLYERLVQIPWRLDLLGEGCGGGHNSPCMPIFMARRVAPWLIP